MNPLFLNKISEINFLFSTQNVTDHTQNLYYFQKIYKRLKQKNIQGMKAKSTHSNLSKWVLFAYTPSTFIIFNLAPQ